MLEKERRLFVRFQMSAQVVIQQEEKTLEGFLIDISYEGIGFYSPQPLKPESLLKFIIINRQLNVNLGGIGRVIYSQPIEVDGKKMFRVGMEVIDIDRIQLKRLLLQIRQL
ncbi:MAG: PilZ domain-containing protein [Candidatus Omnitrophica bacterium]|nr:PilZ domain-containing protein [Candidatus Omnitrophota bacterium]